jgi:hypothetical protein
MLSFSAAVEPTLIEDDLFMAGHLRAQGNVASAIARDGNVNWLTSFKQKDRPKAASVFAIAIDHAASIALLRRR